MHPLSHPHERPDTMTLAIKLTKADTVALWHAVNAQGYAMQAMRELNREQPGKFTAEEIEGEDARLTQAKRALRKVNAIRKAQSEESVRHISGKGRAC